MNEKNNLLDLLYTKLNVYYLFDLHSPPLYSQIIRELEMTEAKDYSLEHWIDASNYILNENNHFTSSESVRQHLLKKLNK